MGGAFRPIVGSVFLFAGGVFAVAQDPEGGEPVPAIENGAVVVPVCLECSWDAKPTGPAFESTFVGVAIANPNPFENELLIDLRNAGGELLSSRKLGTLTERGQLAFLTRDAATGASGEPIPHSLTAKGDLGPVRGFYMVGCDRLQRLDGVGAEPPRAPTLYFPYIRHSEGTSTLLFLANHTDLEEDVVIQLHSPDGVPLSEATIPLPPHGSISGSIDTILGGAVELSDGFLVVRGRGFLSGVAFVGGRRSFVAAPAQVPGEADVLLAPHFFVAADGATQLRLLNAGSAASLSVRAFDDLGDCLAEAVLVVDKGAMKAIDLAELLGLTPGPEGVRSGYLKIRAERGDGDDGRAELLGSVLFEGNDGGYASMLPLIAESPTDSLILHVAQSEQMRIFTGLAILNGDDGPARVDVRALSADGRKTAERTLEIPSRHRVVDLLNGAKFFGESFEQVGGHLRLTSDRPVASFALFGQFDLDYLAAIESQAWRPEEEPDPLAGLVLSATPNPAFPGQVVHLRADLPGTDKSPYSLTWYVSIPWIGQGEWQRLLGWNGWQGSFLTPSQQTVVRFKVVVTDGVRTAERQVSVSVTFGWG
jgi:hypothetical protein